MFGKRELHLYFPYRLGSLAQLICIEMRPMGSATRRLSKVSSPTATLNHHVQQLVSHYYFPSGAAVLEEGGGQQKKNSEGGREGAIEALLRQHSAIGSRQTSGFGSRQTNDLLNGIY